MPLPRCRARAAGGLVEAEGRQGILADAERGGGEHAERTAHAGHLVERMSPNMFSVRMTSNWVGLRTSCMAALSTYMCERAISGHAWRGRR